MTRRIRIPGLVDILSVDEPAAIRALTAEARLDRDFAGDGPALNRLILGRLRRAFRIGGVPFPGVAPRGLPGRAVRQRDLEREIEARLAAEGPAPGELDALAACIRGEGDDAALGRAAQQAVGRLFAPGYAATDETWRAAVLLDAAAREMNPLRRLGWALTGAVGRARRRLAEPVAGDPAALHGTAVAVHTLVRNLQALREVWRDPGRGSIPAPVAAARALRAPLRVARRWTGRAMTPWGEMRPGTLTFLELDAAQMREPGAGMAFLAGAWPQCPAHRWAPALLEAVWIRAGGRAS